MTPPQRARGAGTSFDVIRQIAPGEILFVLSGPVCNQRYAWYRVEYEEIEGWIAEGSSEAYFVEIYPPE
ncbi:MAG: SH3 domain-containing protein [Chloroflexi bacterium]|nr:SH3 domain-containing protein [Chloroflexota bacterium]